MGESTLIEWADHTFNPWWGCSRVSPACRFCYAEPAAARWGFEVWRRHGERRMLSDENWHKPIVWNRAAQVEGVRRRVFCASMADVFEDHPQVVASRRRLWPLIEATPWLDWLLLTKRPENVAAMAPWGETWPGNVWLGVSAETQRWADERIPILLDTPAAVRFISAEPLLGPVDLCGPIVPGRGRPRLTYWLDGRPGWGNERTTPTGLVMQEPVTGPALDWVIVGGESGPRARPTDLAWIRTLVDQCRTSGVAVFVKQLGAPWSREAGAKHPKGGDPAEWPTDLQVREFPAAVAGAVSA